MWLLQHFYVACHMIWKLANARRENLSATEENIDVNTLTELPQLPQGECKGSK
jgi:hypothetical protein